MSKSCKIYTKKKLNIQKYICTLIKHNNMYKLIRKFLFNISQNDQCFYVSTEQKYESNDTNNIN